MSKLLKLSDFNRNCGPTSINTVVKHSEHEVLTACQKAGFIGKGMYWSNIIKALSLLSVKYSKISFHELYEGGSYPTIRKFIKKYPTGTYIIGINGHALTIINGCVVDKNVYKNQMKKSVDSAVKIYDCPIEKDYIKSEYNRDAICFRAYPMTQGYRNGSYNYGVALKCQKAIFRIGKENITVGELLDVGMKRTELKRLIDEDRIFLIKKSNT